MTRDGVTTWKHYVEAPTGTAAVYLRRSSGTPAAETYYLTHDHLGSTDKVLDAAGGVVTVAESFTALGARRGSTWQGTPTPAELAAIAATTRDGFTGHETLDSVGLVHMGGRVYDPVIGRFLSVDPVVRDIGAAQSWNSYGYVEGRVVSWIDPTGFWGCSSNSHPAWDWVGSSECLAGLNIYANYLPEVGRVVVEAPGWPQLPTPEPPMPVFSPEFQSPGFSIGDYAEAGNGQGGEGDQGGEKTQGCNQWLVDLGNAMAELSNSAMDASQYIGGLGATVFVLGLAEPGPVGEFLGGDLLALGGFAAFGSGVLQFSAGAAQTAGGAANNNMEVAAAAVVTSMIGSQWIKGAAPRNPQSARGRRLARQMRQWSAMFGVLYDSLAAAIPDTNAQQASCETDGP